MNPEDMLLANGVRYGDADERFREIHHGQIALIIANGPSLDLVSDDFLNTYHSIGCNRIYVHGGVVPTYFVQLGMSQVNTPEKAAEYHDICRRVEASFVNRMAVGMGHFENVPNLYPIHSKPLHTPNVERGIGNLFSGSPLWAIGIGGSVIYQSLQLAYWMGFRVSLIVGLDHEYPEDENVKWHFYENDLGITDLEGPFGGRESWLERTDASFKNARTAYEADERRIINLTEGSKCTIFETDDILAWSTLK